MFRLSVASKIVILAVGVVILTSIFLGTFSYFRQHEEVIKSIEVEKQNEVQILTSHIQSKIDELRNDVQFLASTPPISGIMRAKKNGGIDPKDGSNLKTWKNRLSTIFEEMLFAKENYLQIRFIGVKDKGKELVRVERAENSKIIKIDEVDLQKKGEETYFKETFNLAPHKTYLSDFNPNRELGKIQYPVQLVLRASVPIYESRAKPFGLVIINIDYTKIFKALESVLTNEHEYFVTDNRGIILLNSDIHHQSYVNSEKVIKVEDYLHKLGQGQIKLDENIESKVYHVEESGNKNLIVSHKLRYNPIDYNDYLSIYLVVNKEKILREVEEKTRQFLFLISFLVLIATILALYFSSGLTKSLRRLTDFAYLIAQGKFGSKLDINSEDEIGVLANSLNTLSDELKLKDLELKHQQEALNASAIVAQTDVNGRITYVNDKFVEISQFSREELIGYDHRIVNSGFHSKEFFKGMWTTIKSGQTWHGEVLNKAKDDTHYWVDTTIYPIKNNHGVVEKFVAIRFEITEKKEALKQLEQANLEAKTALKDKAAFFANMSHEIRTPLNGIIGFTDLILDEKLPKATLNQVANIKECSHSLLMIVNDILDISKIEAGKLSIEKRSIDLKKSLTSTLSVFKVELMNKGLHLDFIFDEKIPKFILGDALRIRQILINLIGNAIKFTHHGQIEVSVKLLKTVENQIEILFTVKDTGIGIPIESQSKIFGSYSQVDASTTRKYGGTGLGLSITKKIISLMGGEIWVESEYGVGSSFFFTIKTIEAAEEIKEITSNKKKEISKEVNSSKKRILVAEDNKLNQTLINSVLKKMGFTNIVIVENGRKAVTELSNNRYDFVFMDVQMPDMDGLEATKYIRNELNLPFYPIIIGLSANAFPEDVEAGLNSGMDYYLEKPLDQSKIADVLNEASRKAVA